MDNSENNKATNTISPSNHNTSTTQLVVYIISDSLGDTASAMVSAAISQFSDENVRIEKLLKLSSAKEAIDFLDAGVTSRENSHESDVVFFTIIDPNIAKTVSAHAEKLGISHVDLLGPAVDAIAHATGKTPLLQAGVNRELDDAYFKRIEAMDYAVDHDDGRLPEEYKDADIILIGVSRTSKTPLSMYLALSGYKVANLPLAPGVNPPKQIFDVEPWRIYGLMSNASVLSGIRRRRIGAEAAAIAQNYASEQYIEEDLREARAFMRKLGCIVIHTDNRAIEETAQEIIGYYEKALAAQAQRRV